MMRSGEPKRASPVPPAPPLSKHDALSEDEREDGHTARPARCGRPAGPAQSCCAPRDPGPLSPADLCFQQPQDRRPPGPGSARGVHSETRGVAARFRHLHVSVRESCRPRVIGHFADPTIRSPKHPGVRTESRPRLPRPPMQRPSLPRRYPYTPIPREAPIPPRSVQGGSPARSNERDPPPKNHRQIIPPRAAEALPLSLEFAQTASVGGGRWRGKATRPDRGRYHPRSPGPP